MACNLNKENLLYVNHLCVELIVGTTIKESNK